MRALALRLVVLVALASCSSEIYLRDGVTDGDTFYLADNALVDSDPVLQSWGSYSLTLSVCQLQIGGDNPARESSFECELTARRHLVESWADHQNDESGTSDPYLDLLSIVHGVDFLPEYVAYYLNRKQWQLPSDLDHGDFEVWRRQYLPRHKAETRLIGSWNYARKVNVIR
ncbi:MAG: hypothetical protein WDZ50_06385 [Woeseia sp.]